jgi:mannose-6-phosphate isomerase
VLSSPSRLPPAFLEKVWGSTHLEPWFPNPSTRIGEVHFHAEPRLPILVKFIFTTEKLSVQVHPKGDSGKTEMWHILRADPGAVIALGFHQPVTRDELRQASLTGEVERMLRWFPAQEGQTYFVPAGTVHAIGGGIALCEIQQNSDVTYRLYDYGRPRELHLDQALAVADLGEHPGPSLLPVKCPYFVTGMLDNAEAPAAHQIIFLEGHGTVNGAAFGPGEVWLAPPGTKRAQIRPTGPVRALRTWVP